MVGNRRNNCRICGQTLVFGKHIMPNLMGKKHKPYAWGEDSPNLPKNKRVKL